MEAQRLTPEPTTDLPYQVTILNGFYYYVTPDGYRAASRAAYLRSLARTDDVLPFGQLPSDWAAWVES